MWRIESKEAPGYQLFPPHCAADGSETLHTTEGFSGVRSDDP